MIHYRYILLFMCLSFVACSQQTPIPDNLSISERLSWIDSLMAEWEDDGASGVIYISHRGNTLLEKGFGSASCDGAEPVTPAHHFMIGSITKEFTYVLGYILAERGNLSLSETVQDYFPSITGDVGAITLQQLIEHTAGLPDLIDENGRSVRYRIEYDYEPVSREELIARIARTRLEFESGSREEYSNLAYQLLAAIYEVATGQRYEALLQEYIYQPAMVDATAFWFDDHTSREFADGCRRGDRHWGNPIDERMWGQQGSSWNLKGAGGLISTAQSLARFFEGVGSNVYFATEAGAEDYKTARMFYSNLRQQRVMGPAGSNGIFNAVALWQDSDQFCIVMFTNRARYQAEDNRFQEILRLFPPASLELL